MKYKNVIRVIEYEEAEAEFKETSQHFQSSAYADQITNKYAREYKTSIFTFINAKVDINKILEQEIKEVTDYSK